MRSKAYYREASLRESVRVENAARLVRRRSGCELAEQLRRAEHRDLATAAGPRDHDDVVVAVDVERLGALEEAEGDLVADIGPRGLAAELEVDAFGGGEVELLRGDQDRRVDQGNEADPGVAPAHDSSSAAVTTLCAISEIFLLWLIAVLRSRA